jgi:tetratricopeptide (TPR) repeat protein
MQTELRWNQGDYTAAISEIRALAESSSNVAAVARSAKLEQDLGNFCKAEELFCRAEDLIVESDPFLVAWLFVQHGELLIDVGQAEQAKEFFREAMARLPDYVAAHEGYGRALALCGENERALRVLENCAAKSRSPELMAQLGSLSGLQGRLQDADTWISAAGREFEILVAKYPEAMYWHAGQFYLKEGNNPARTEELLVENAKLRPNSESWFALAQAQLANGKIDDARESVTKILGKPVRPRELRTFLTGEQFHDLLHRSRVGQ